MPYPPLKSEQYHNIGGVNRKASPYMTGTNEVIDILNFDYTQPGSYTTRPGSTAWIYGSTAMASVLAGAGSTSNVLSIDSVNQFTRLDGSSYLVFTNQGNAFFKSVTGYTNYGFFNLKIPTILSFAPFVNYLFIAGAYNTIDASGDFQKFSGYDVTSYSLPAPLIRNLVSAVSPGASFGTGFTGVYQYTFAYINERGYMGPVSIDGYTSINGYTYGYFPGVQLEIVGPQYASIQLNTQFQPAGPVPNGYGITAICVFRSQAQAGGFATTIPSWRDLVISPVGQAALIIQESGGALGPLSNTGNTLGGQQLWFTMTPSYVNVFNNALFMSGFGYTQNGFSAGSQVGGNLPSTVYFSDITDPELVQPTYSFPVKTNDSDVVTGLFNYISQQMIFKNRSFFSLSGTDSTNYSLSQISSDYGCISNRAIATFNQILWFLDRKGVCQYDGANVQIISNRVESVFRSMNLAAAANTAAMIHVKDRNEIWTAIPVNGATTNNHLVIYDYVANAFSEWSGPQVASLALAFDPNQQFTPIFGNYSGLISYFNATLFTDNGIGYTCSVTPRYFGGQGNEMGYSVEKMFRRLYFDITDNWNTGQTTIVNVNLLSDFGTSQPIQSQTFAMGMGHTQTRLDFGMPGKSGTFEAWFQPQTPALNFNGYTIEYRYQRNE